MPISNFNEWKWETFGPFKLTAAVLRSEAPAPIGPTWNKQVKAIDRKRQERPEFPIPTIFEQE